MAGVRKEEYAKVFTELEAVAEVRSIKSSNEIEGIIISDERIQAIVNQNSAPLNHNGRISRLLSLLLLYKNGFDAGKYVSFEEQISKYKAYYYDSLKQSSTAWDANENTYFPFVENFLSILYMCYKELDKRFAVVNGKRITKKASIEATVLNSLTPRFKS